MMKKESWKILRQGFVFRLLQREKLKILIVVRLYSYSHACKDDRKMVCRRRKDRGSVVSCVMGSIWMILLSTAEVDVRHDWVETGVFCTTWEAKKLWEPDLTEASVSGQVISTAVASVSSTLCERTAPHSVSRDSDFYSESWPWMQSLRP